MSSNSIFCPITRQKEVDIARIIDTEQKNLIGGKVRELRKKRNLSQQQLADKLETMAIYICRGSISRIEDCSRTVTDIELYGLSQVLSTPIQDFFSESDKK